MDAAVLEVINYLSVFPNMRTPLYKCIRQTLQQIDHIRDEHTRWLEASREAGDQVLHEQLWKELWAIRRTLASEENCLMFLRNKMWQRELELEKVMLFPWDMRRNIGAARTVL